MTTVAPVSVTWIRLIGDGVNITLTPSPDFDLLLTEDRVEYDGHLDPLTVRLPPDLSMSVDLVPLRQFDGDGVLRCETRAREVAAQLGVGRAVRGEFALEAALDGEQLPYNRVEVPRVLDDEEPLPAVRVFTAKILAADGVAYMLRQVD
ncbi:hypothetical protein [Streptomyces sp. NPDC000351]|uniref:hypothetical protein n=1 Tax=Streptomyces sp. NPDC000351 TaxID=3154250 RepID=UPI003329E0BD